MKPRGRPRNEEKSELMEQVRKVLPLDILKAEGAKSKISLNDLKKLAQFIQRKATL